MSEESSVSAIPAAGRTAVLIDDEPGVLFSLKLLLGAFGFQVVGFSDPLQAVQYLSTASACDMVLSDLRMPKLDGLGVLQEARKLRPFTPFILMSGHASPDEIEKAQSLGSSGFLAKPFSGEDLKTLVAGLEDQGTLRH